MRSSQERGLLGTETGLQSHGLLWSGALSMLFGTGCGVPGRDWATRNRQGAVSLGRLPGQNALNPQMKIEGQGASGLHSKRGQNREASAGLLQTDQALALHWGPKHPLKYCGIQGRPWPRADRTLQGSEMEGRAAKLPGWRSTRKGAWVIASTCFCSLWVIPANMLAQGVPTRKLSPQTAHSGKQACPAPAEGAEVGGGGQGLMCGLGCFSRNFCI